MCNIQLLLRIGQKNYIFIFPAFDFHLIQLDQNKYFHIPSKILRGQRIIKLSLIDTMDQGGPFRQLKTCDNLQEHIYIL